MKECINICSITGKQKNIENFLEVFEKNFSMKDFFKDEEDTEIKRIKNWGCYEDISLINQIYSSDVGVYEIYFITDIPNIFFWRYVARKFNIFIEHYYYNPQDEYVGHAIIDSDDCVRRYSEEPKTNIYKKILKESTLENAASFIGMKKSKVIKMQDILKNEEE